MTTYTERLIDLRPELLMRAAALRDITTLPEEALIDRLQAPHARSRLSRSCVGLHRKWTKASTVAEQDPISALIAAMTEVTRARGAGTLHATIALDDSWGFGAAVRGIAHDVALSVSRVITARDEVPLLETICSEAERGEVSIYAPYSERVLKYVICPALLENALRKLAELRLKADAISSIDARRLVVFAFDHLLSRCLLPLKAILASPVSIDGQIHLMGPPELHPPAFNGTGQLRPTCGPDRPLSEATRDDTPAVVNPRNVGAAEASMIRAGDE
ncbi:hypothetical protein QP164_02640 [Sphingomonas sp. LR59]|uniref:hypothetical protein n=1 Tax=Sphingomonas sp. LR59 TaxID=3050232 RepID=UPI002FDF8C0C